VFVYINGVECKALEGQTILEVARENKIFIPSLCFGVGAEPSGACGICIVETDGQLLRACITAVREGLIADANSPRVFEARKNILELLISTHTGDCVAPCKIACPAQSDCQGFIALIAAGKFREAVELMKDAHPFPASISRICTRPCEAECRRNLVDAPVNIADLKRFAADSQLENFYIPEIGEATGKSVAVVGGGPAGLTAAFFLRKAGHSVDVYEQMPKMGGLLRYGIPEFRLPKAVLDAEIEALQRMGINFFNRMTLDSDAESRYDAVIKATGANTPFTSGMEFLKAVATNNPPIIGERVVVTGGSDIAIDAARTALRLGAEVIVLCDREEISEEAVAEGVQFIISAEPLEIISQDGKVTGIRLLKNGDEEFIEASAIIEDIAISVENGEPLFNGIVYNTREITSAIEAIAQGRKLAEIANKNIFGAEKNISEQLPDILIRDKKTAEYFSQTQKKPRQEAKRVVKVGARLDFSPVKASLTPAEVLAEADRCLSCGCADFYECKLLALANAYGADTNKYPANFHKKPKHKPDGNFSFHRDMNKCVLCGLCVAVCGKKNETLSAVKRGFNMGISAAFGEPLQNRDECSLCGNCVARCPVGALAEVSPLPKHFITREKITASACTLCENACDVNYASAAGEILRCLPPEGKTLCENGRFAFLRFGEKIITPLVRKDDILRRATLNEAAKAVREGFNILKARYGAESIGVAVSPRYTLEDISAVKKYAAYIGTPHIFTQGFENCDELNGLIVFGGELPATLAKPEFFVLQAAYSSALTTKLGRLADVVLPSPAFGEVVGTIQKDERVLSVNAALPPACGFQTRQLITVLSEGECV
jgi:formate dehydrogenase major subunit